MIGYYLIFISLRYEENKHIQSDLDRGNYNHKDLLILKVPILLPYQPDWKHYERMNGNLVYHGLHYTAVKHRVYHDTVYTAYTPDPYKNRLYQKMDDLVGLLTNAPLSDHQNNHIWDYLLKEYLPMAFSGCFLFPGTFSCLPLPDQHKSLQNLVREVILPPPRATA